MTLRKSLALLTLLAMGTGLGFGLKSVLADGIPSSNPLYYSGTLTEGGTLVTGTRALTVNLWADGTTSGSPLCTTVASTANVVNGRFRMALASSCKAVINLNSTVFVEVIDGATSLGRSPIGGVPYAVEADHAVSATNATNVTGPQAQQVVPSGAVMAFNLPQCPAGWTPYAAAAGRVLVGTSSALTLGATIGADQVTLTTQQMPSHSHSITDQPHQHNATGQVFMEDHFPNTCTGYTGFGGQPAVPLCGDPATQPAMTGITGTNSTGGGQPFDNRQASLALLYCQKN